MMNHIDVRTAINSALHMRHELTPASAPWHISATFKSGAADDVFAFIGAYSSAYSEHVCVTLTVTNVKNISSVHPAVKGYDDILRTLTKDTICVAFTSSKDKIHEKIGHCVGALDSFGFTLMNITHLPHLALVEAMHACVRQFFDKPFSGNISDWVREAANGQ